MSHGEMNTIMERLGQIHGDLRSIRNEVRHVDEKLDEVKIDLYGDGGDNNPGIKGRVMRLENRHNSEVRKDDHRWLVYAAVIGSLVLSAGDIIMRVIFH